MTKKILAPLMLAALAWGCGNDSDDTKLPANPTRPGNEKPRVQTASHVDGINGVRFDLPGGWIVNQNKTGLMFISPTDDDEDPAIGYTKPLPQGPDGKPDDFKKAAETAAARVPKVEPSAKDFKQESVRVAGSDALMLSFNLKMDDSAYRSKQVYFGSAEGGCLVQFSYPAANEATYAPVLKMVLGSLELTKK